MPELRESVLWFAEQMEMKLRKNDHRSGWEGESVAYLQERLVDEIGELFVAIVVGDDVVSECADVANFAMMIATIDKAKGKKDRHYRNRGGKQDE